MIYEVEIDGKVRRIEIQRTGTTFVVAVDGRRHGADVAFTDGVCSLLLTAEDGAGATSAPGGIRQSFDVAVVEHPGTPSELTVHVNGRLVSASVSRERGSWGRRGHDARESHQGPARLKAPMPGRVVRVLVEKGDVVAVRQGVVIVEAMKMENELRAPKAGTVSAVLVAEGTSVEAGTPLIVIE